MIHRAGHGPYDWIYYKKINRGKYKYELTETACALATGIGTGKPVHNNYIYLYASGWLCVCATYAWDGPSGPTIDTPNFMRGSLFHDALYQLMREGLLPQSCRKAADELLRVHCREDGMPWLRAYWV